MEVVTIDHTETYEARSAPRAPPKLTDQERDDLAYVYGGIAGELGMRSVHGALEAKLLRAPPRADVQKAVLEELGRAGGRACEGAVSNALYEDHRETVPVVTEWRDLWSGARGKHVEKVVRVRVSFTRSEIRRAIRDLVRKGQVERLATAMPPGDAAVKRWTGFDLRATVTLALVHTSAPLTREQRWAAADAALEAELHTLECKDAPPGGAEGGGGEVPSSRRARRIWASLERLPEWATAALFRQVQVAGDARVFGGGKQRLDEAVLAWRLERAKVARERNRGGR